MPKQQLAFEVYYEGAWHDLVVDDDVLTGSPVTVTRGQGDESPALRPSRVTAQLANDDDRYRVSNPESPLYGKAGVNAPVRVSVGTATRTVVGSTAWRSDQTQDFRRYPRRGSAWTDFEGGGTLQRINQWTQPLRSAIRRLVDLYGITPAEYWPMEDPAGSFEAVSAAGGEPMTPVDVVRYTLPSGKPIPPGGAPEFGRGNGVPGAAPLVSFQRGGTLRAPIRTNTFDGYAIDWVMQYGAGASGSTTGVLAWSEAGGTYVNYEVDVTSSAVTVFHSNAADFATLGFTGSATAVLTPFDGAPHHYRYQVVQNGGSYLALFYVDGILYDTADNFSGGMAGTVGHPTVIEWNRGEDQGDMMPTTAGHLIVWDTGQPTGQTPVFEALNGHAGEVAAVRFDRLLDEELIPCYVSLGWADSMPMGPQRVGTLAELLEEIARTDDALIFDYHNIANPYMLCRVDRYNQTPSLTLTPEDLPAVPRESLDDRRVRNRVTAKQRDGGESIASDDVGPMGTAAPPTGVGAYQQTVDVNLDDQALLPQVANWWMRKGTVDLPRFPVVVVNVSALSAAKVAEVETVSVGSVITITGLREYTIRLWVLGFDEVIGTHGRKIKYSCALDQQYDVGVYGSHANQRRYDSETTTVKTAVTKTGTTIVFRTTDLADIWSTTSTPYDVIIAGEKMTVTTMGAASLVSGAYDQSATVVRSANAIVKTQAAGAAIRVSPQARWAL